VIAVVAAVAIAGLILFFCRRRKYESTLSKQPIQEMEGEFGWNIRKDEKLGPSGELNQYPLELDSENRRSISNDGKQRPRVELPG
jgi:hypothetical protein